MKWFHHFREMKSEKFSPFTLFEKWKWKSNDSKSRSRSESENQMTQNRDREVNFQKNSREFSRIETLAGHCFHAGTTLSLTCETLVVYFFVLGTSWIQAHIDFQMISVNIPTGTILRSSCRWLRARHRAAILSGGAPYHHLTMPQVTERKYLCMLSKSQLWNKLCKRFGNPPSLLNREFMGRSAWYVRGVMLGWSRGRSGG